MIEVDAHLKWGAYCCLQSTQCPVRIHRRSWARSALFVVETMLTTTELPPGVLPYAMIVGERVADLDLDIWEVYHRRLHDLIMAYAAVLDVSVRTTDEASSVVMSLIGGGRDDDDDPEPEPVPHPTEGERVKA